MLFALTLTFLTPYTASAGLHAFPPDFVKPEEVIGGAGGSKVRTPEKLGRLPVIFIADNERIHTDWQGANCGLSEGNVYEAFIGQGFDPFELWMLDLVPAQGHQLTSLELRTDNLKEMIFAVLRYTGANQVNIMAHGAGAVLAQATLVKYNLFYAVHSVAYIAGPFHGSYACSYDRCIDGLPVCCALTPGSDFLQDVLLPDETPHNPGLGRSATRYLTVRNGRRFGDSWFQRNPESPSLAGAVNLAFGHLDHDGLRCSADVLSEIIPFLTIETDPFKPGHDRDGDGFQGSPWGGADCDDTDSNVFPGATDTCEDGIDQDCNGVDISCLPGKDRDMPGTALPKVNGIDQP